MDGIPRYDLEITVQDAHGRARTYHQDLTYGRREDPQDTFILFTRQVAQRGYFWNDQETDTQTWHSPGQICSIVKRPHPHGPRPE